jgi:hypothetical protein
VSIEAETAAQTDVQTPAGDDPTPELHGGSTKPKKFANVEELWDALEEYGDFHDGTKTRRVGDRVQGGGEENFSSTQERIMRQNKTIDRAMIRLAVLSPQSHRLIHAYYRMPGPSGSAAARDEARGWIAAAKYAGLLVDQQDRLPRTAFDLLLTDAVWLLFVAHHAKRVLRP